jgi:hypothetical protein
MNQFFSFDKMITPIIIKILFWLGLGVSIIVGLIYIAIGSTAWHGAGGGQVLVGVLALVIGPLLVRLQCEFIIIMFKNT